MPSPEITFLHSREEYEKFVQASAFPDPVPAFKQSTVTGFCHVCNSEKTFCCHPTERVTRGHVSWREQLTCPGCRLNNRARASIHLLDFLSGGHIAGPLYLGESQTPLYEAIARRARGGLTGSEYLGDRCRPGQKRWKRLSRLKFRRIRHEDLQNLSFEGDRFAWLMAFDVLEHVPDFRLALRECYRCLNHGGRLLLSVPFCHELDQSFPLARRETDGTLTFLSPPEYHGDPFRKSHGCLCYTRFGWDILKTLAELGFSKTALVNVHSRRHAYFGHDLLFIYAVKP